MVCSASSSHQIRKPTQWCKHLNLISSLSILAFLVKNMTILRPRSHLAADTLVICSGCSNNAFTSRLEKRRRKLVLAHAHTIRE